jgi:hypothetical protein
MRLSRIQAAKDAISNAFIASKKRNSKPESPHKELKSSSSTEDHHHHLLACLEKATVYIYFLF